VRRYFFHVYNGERLMSDHVGLLLPDIASALREADDAVQIGLASGQQDWSRWHIEVADCHGSLMWCYLYLTTTQATGQKGPQPKVRSFRSRLLHLWARLVDLVMAAHQRKRLTEDRRSRPSSFPIERQDEDATLRRWRA